MGTAKFHLNGCFHRLETRDRNADGLKYKWALNTLSARGRKSPVDVNKPVGKATMSAIEHKSSAAADGKISRRNRLRGKEFCRARQIGIWASGSRNVSGTISPWLWLAKINWTIVINGSLLGRHGGTRNYCDVNRCYHFLSRYLLRHCDRCGSGCSSLLNPPIIQYGSYYCRRCVVQPRGN